MFSAIKSEVSYHKTACFLPTATAYPFHCDPQRHNEMEADVSEKLINIDELAGALGGLGRASIYRHIKSLPGFPQPLKIGAATRFRMSDVEAYIDSISGQKREAL